MGKTILVQNKEARKSFRNENKMVQHRATNKKATKKMNGIPIPKNGKQALEFNKRFSNNKWRDAIKKLIATMI